MSVGERETEAPCCPFSFGLAQSLLLCPSVLEPYFNLGLSQFEVLGKLCSLGHREVLLLAELPLESYELRAGKWSPGFPVFLLFLESRRAGTWDIATLSGAWRIDREWRERE